MSSTPPIPAVVPKPPDGQGAEIVISEEVSLGAPREALEEDGSVFSATVATDAPSEVEPTVRAAEPTASDGIPGDLGEDDDFDSFAAAVPADSNQSSYASAPELPVAADLEVTPSANMDDFSSEPEATNDDEFGDFGARSEATSGVDDEFSGSATADAKPDSTVEEDDGFGGFADAGAAGEAEDDDDFGGFADASPAAADDPDDVRPLTREPAQHQLRAHPVCVRAASDVFPVHARRGHLRSQDFGAFGDGDLGGGDFGSFSTSATPAPPAATTTPTTTPQPATQEQGVSDPAATASGLLSSSVFDGEDLGPVKAAAAEFLRRSLPPPQATDTTGVTGCPTLDQVLTGQVRKRTTNALLIPCASTDNISLFMTGQSQHFGLVNGVFPYPEDRPQPHLEHQHGAVRHGTAAATPWNRSGLGRVR